VFAARIENIALVPDRASIHVDIRNTGERPITAFAIAFYLPSPNGERIPCGGRGVDMIDWSDPMPGRGISVHMRRNWIPPDGSLLFDGYPKCPGASAALESIQVELNFIMFDDGNGEGDSHRMESIIRARQEARNERAKWVSRFSALHTAPDLRTSAQALYQDLVEATRSSEINPDDASRHGVAKATRDELQRLALEITQWAFHSEHLQKNEFLDWRITDLEQRTARLVRGSGKIDVNPL
jgi:hypothetical protein